MFADFSNVPRGSRKFRDWRFLFQEPDWADARATFTNDYTTLMSNMEHPVYYCPELFLEPEDAALQDNVWNSVSFLLLLHNIVTEIAEFCHVNNYRHPEHFTHPDSIEIWEIKICCSTKMCPSLLDANSLTSSVLSTIFIRMCFSNTY